MKFSIKTRTENIDNLDVDLSNIIKQSMPELVAKIEQTIRDGFGKNGKPNVRSGALRDSIRVEVENELLSVGSDSPYALIQEFGGVINGKPWLMFKIGNQFVKVKSVTLKPKPYIVTGVEDSINSLCDILENNIIRDL